MLNINRTKTITLAFAGSLLSLAALLIFTILPASELANGIQYSGKDALWVLSLSPVLSLVGSINFIYAFLKDYKVWQNFLSKPAVLGAGVVLGALMIFNLLVYLTYLINQFKLGFVAPYSGTVYDSFKILLIVVTILQFIISILATVATAKK